MGQVLFVGDMSSLFQGYCQTLWRRCRLLCLVSVMQLALIVTPRLFSEAVEDVPRAALPTPPIGGGGQHGSTAG